MKRFCGLLAFVITVTLMCNCFAAEVKMTDVDYNTELGKSIDKLVKGGVVNGIPQDDGTFKYAPENPVTRAEFCKMINTTFGYEIAANNIFTDVDSTKWYYVYVLPAIHYGYIQGYGDGRFGGEDYITREQVCVILSKIVASEEEEKAKETAETTTENTEEAKTAPQVKIEDKVSEWARAYVEDIIAKGYIPLEEGNKFRATENMTRGELAFALDDFVVIKEAVPDTNNTGNTSTNVILPGGIRPSGGGGGSSGGSGDSTGDNESTGGGTVTPDPEEEYTITYELNGIGELPEYAKTSFTASQLPYTLPILTGTAMEVFGGWYTDSGFSGEAITKIVSGTSDNVVLYAKWDPRYTEDELQTSEKIYDNLEFAISDLDDKIELEILEFDEKGQRIFDLLDSCVRNVYALKESGVVLSNTYVRGKHSTEISEITSILDGMTVEERDAFEFEINKMNTTVLKSLVDLFDVNINYGK